MKSVLPQFFILVVVGNIVLTDGELRLVIYPLFIYIDPLFSSSELGMILTPSPPSPKGHIWQCSVTFLVVNNFGATTGT